MADDMLLTDDLDDETDDADDAVTLLDDEQPIDDGKSDLVLAEEDAIAEEELSEPAGLNGPNTDPGAVDEATIYGQMIEQGAGASVDPEEDTEALGMHEEELIDDSDDADDMNVIDDKDLV